MIINCDFCNKQFNKAPSRIKNSKNNFCSNECKNKGKISKQTVICETCGKQIIRAKSQINKANYCSKDCVKKVNEIVTEGEKTKIILNSEKYGTHECFIDTEDLKKVLELPTLILKYDKFTKGYYVSYVVWNNNKAKNYKLHRFIMGFPDNLEVDHINHNTLDNRKTNLRLVNKSQNAQNKIKPPSNNTSGILGVSWKKDKQKWKAYLTLNGKQIHVGYFSEMEEAERAIKEARKKYMPFSQEALALK